MQGKKAGKELKKVPGKMTAKKLPDRAKTYKKACPVCRNRIATTHRRIHLIRHAERAQGMIDQAKSELSRTLDALKVLA